MSETTQDVGQRGEAFAATHLEQAGYRIEAKNWRQTGLGEIDIVARDGNEIVFVEVRTRRGPLRAAIEQAVASVDAQKQARLLQLAQAYLAAHDLAETPWRIDVVAVSYADNRFAVQVIRDAATW